MNPKQVNVESLKIMRCQSNETHFTMASCVGKSQRWWVISGSCDEVSVPWIPYFVIMKFKTCEINFILIFKIFNLIKDSLFESISKVHTYIEN